MPFLERTDIIDRAGRANEVAEPLRQDSGLHSLEGTIQRVNYRTRELRVIAEGHPWAFVLANDCQLWLNSIKVPFHCFQPLDHVRILYVDEGSILVSEALYLDIEEPMLAEFRPKWGIP
jgi:hypothetical protein